MAVHSLVVPNMKPFKAIEFFVWSCKKYITEGYLREILIKSQIEKYVSSVLANSTPFKNLQKYVIKTVYRKIAFIAKMKRKSFKCMTDVRHY